MKKYIKPEIVALALETVDVIAVSTAQENAINKLNTAMGNPTKSVDTTSSIKEFTNTWSW